jgi:hypothetical protein
MWLVETIGLIVEQGRERREQGLSGGFERSEFRLAVWCDYYAPP